MESEKIKEIAENSSYSNLLRLRNICDENELKI